MEFAEDEKGIWLIQPNGRRRRAIKTSCKHCNKEFFTPKRTQIAKFCSRECVINSKSHKRRITQCVNCGKDTKNDKFCSHSCSAAFNNKRRKLSKETKAKISIAAVSNMSHLNFIGNKSTKRRPKYCKLYLCKCKKCGKDFLYKRKDKKCCSDKCYHETVGGYRENSVRSNGAYVTDSFGNNVYLQSSYELECAKVLDRNNIKWVRPSYLKYRDSLGKNRKYYPDFYLPSIDVYLDPKNKLLIGRDTEKIHLASIQNNVKILILGKDIIYNEKLLLKTVLIKT